MNVLGYPSDVLDSGVANEILRGGLSKVKEAGALVLGGHTTDNREVLYGLSVTGTVSPAQLVRNSTAQIGDVLVLTKPLGSGLVASVSSRNGAATDETSLSGAVACLCLLNKHAAGAMREVQVLP